MGEKREPVVIDYHPESTVELAIKKIFKETFTILIFFLYIHGLIIVKGFWMTLLYFITVIPALYTSIRFFVGEFGWLPAMCSP